MSSLPKIAIFLFCISFVAQGEYRPRADCGTLSSATDIPTKESVEFLKTLKKTVSSHDLSGLAMLFKYPLRVNARRVNKADLSKMTPMVTKEIKTAAQLERNYSTLFPAGTILQIQAQSETQLKCQGGIARIGHGELWLKQEAKGSAIQIVTINLDQDGLELVP
jgi:hypothetical protein